MERPKANPNRKCLAIKRENIVERPKTFFPSVIMFLVTSIVTKQKIDTCKSIYKSTCYQGSPISGSLLLSSFET